VGSTSGAKPHRLRAFLRRHWKSETTVVTVLLLVLGTIGWYLWNLNSKLDDIPRFSTDQIADRPDPDDDRDLNILLLGSDKGKPIAGYEDTSLAEDAVAAEWPVGKYRSDTLMIVHISADRDRAYVVSIPRDSFVDMYDASGTPQGKNKINAAFSESGPNGTIATVEHLTGLRMDHVAIIDWAGFKDLSTAVGGVPVTIPEAFYDYKQDKQWEARDYLLEGEEALQYVRTRHGLPGSDFDRIDRQQNFLRSLMSKLLESADLFKPRRFTATVTALTENLTVDEAWDSSEIRNLAIGLRGMEKDNVEFLTVPVAGTPTIDVYGSIVALDLPQSRELFRALGDSDLDAYIEKYPDALLGDADEIR
jgi:LCP family protein required for cell wall assembly